jgi:drug/metabolite transporter (DMT)-like permease
MQPTLLLRLCNQRIYLFGVGCQLTGFTLAFFARRDLPLFLVQASVAAGLGVMALLGVVFLKWRLPRAEIALLCLLGFGIAALVYSAKPGVAHRLTPAGFTMLVAVLVVIGVLGFFAARLRGAIGAATLGALAGLAFGAAAVDSRVLAGAHHWSTVITHPLLYLLFAHALLGQLLLGLAMQRGPTTVAVAAMDAASTAPAAIIGLLLLGDQIWPGRDWAAALGFACTLAAVVGMARFAQPQPAATPVSSPSAAPALPRPVGAALVTTGVHPGASAAVPRRAPAPLTLRAASAADGHTRRSTPIPLRAAIVRPPTGVAEVGAGSAEPIDRIAVGRANRSAA